MQNLQTDICDHQVANLIIGRIDNKQYTMWTHQQFE